MYSLKYVGQKMPNKKYKRIIYLGLRNSPPTSLDYLSNSNISKTKTIEEEIIEPDYKYRSSNGDILPVLAIWENSKMERFYAEAV